MTATRNRPALYVRKARGMGRGVFAGRAYRTGEVLEVCPVIVLPGGNPVDAGTVLERYVFQWSDEAVAIALGYGSLYNHSADPNAWFAFRAVRGEVVFRALRPIAADEQLFIDYGWTAEDAARLLGPPD